MRRKILAGCLLLALMLSGCGTNDPNSGQLTAEPQVMDETVSPKTETDSQEQNIELLTYEDESEDSGAEEADAEASDISTGSTDSTNQETVQESEEKIMTLTIAGNEVAVEWEENASVDALRELVQDSPLTISMSMYGGFEQVGSLGMSHPRNDEQTTTSAGDIVLYSGNQIVVFYGSNSWAYTRLGKITDKKASELEELLGKEDATIEISVR